MEQGNPYVQRAHLLREQNRFKEAIKEAGLALQQNPEDVEALSIIGHCKIDLKLYDDAIEILQKCIHLNPEEDYVYYLLAFAYYQKDWYHKALNYLENAIALYPYNSGYFSLKGYIYIALEEYESALESANEGLEVYAEDTGCLNCRTTALFKLKRKDEAIETIQDALAIDPEDYLTHCNYGWHFLERGKYKEANTHFKEALRINPNYPHAKEGFKASLKAKLPFYRWLLQYSLWIQEQPKWVRWAFFIGLYLLVRIAGMLTKNVNTAFAIFLGAIILIYVLFVLLSWLGNALANLYLLFNKQGQYLLDVSEKWSARMVGICLGLSLVSAALAFIINELFFISSLVLLSFCVVFTEIQFPIKPFKGTARNVIAQLVILFGVLAGLSKFIHTDLTLLFGFLYFILFVGFMWSSPFSRR